MHVEEDEQIGRSVALILAVVALELSRRGRDRLARLADELGRALVEADHRALRIGRFGVEVEHILHAGDVLAVDLRNAPHVLAPRLEVVLGQAPAHGLAREAVVLGEPDQLASQQFQGPAGTALRRAWNRRWRPAGLPLCLRAYGSLPSGVHLTENKLRNAEVLVSDAPNPLSLSVVLGLR